MSSSIIYLWFVIGDFNVVIGAHEKIGLPPQHISSHEFRNAIDSCDLRDINTSDSIYTWARRRGTSYMECLLDRAFAFLVVLIFGTPSLVLPFPGITRTIILFSLP